MSERVYRDRVARLTKEIADLEKKASAEHGKLMKLRSQAGNARRAASRTTSASIRASKEREAERKEKDAAASHAKFAGLEDRKATKVRDLARAQEQLASAEKQEQRRRQSADRKRREAELRHERELTREARSRAAAERSIGFGEPRRLLPQKIKVLFFAANPLDQSRLRLDEEVREVTAQIRASDYRDSVELVSRWAVRPLDLLQALNEDKPHVVHFSGHGSNNAELVFQDDEGASKPVTLDAITATIGTAADHVRVIVFNACYSRDHAEAATEHVEAAIGMNTAIGDEAARVFAAKLYSAIGFGRSVQEAFNQGIAALKLEGIPEDATPELFSRADVDPSQVILVRP
jgi:hypothetical protein